MKYDKEIFKNLTLISQVGLSMIIPILICVFAGVMLDRYFSSQTTLGFLLLGIAVGCRNTYVLIMKSAEYKPEYNDKIKPGKDFQIEDEENEN